MSKQASPEVAANSRVVVQLKIPALLFFEPLFALFLFAGVYKVYPGLAWIPVDLTAMFLVLSVVAAGPILMQNPRMRIDRKSWSFLAIYAVFMAWCAVSLAWTPGHRYGSSKLLYLVTLVSWSLFGGCAVIGSDGRRIRRFLVSVACVGAWMSMAILVLVIGKQNIHTVEWSRHYLGLGRLIGLGAIIVAGYLALHQWHTWRSIGLFLLLGIYASVLLVAGGRGPFLATVASLFLLAPVAIRQTGGILHVNRTWALVTGITALGVFGIIWTLGNVYDLSTLVRIQDSLAKGGGSSALTRIWLYRHAWEGWLAAPIAGHGLGGFGDVLRWGDIRVYPHNMLLEILVELGVIGFTLFGLLVVPVLLRALRTIAEADWLRVVLLMMVVNALLNAMVTGDLADNRVFFALLGVLAAPAARILRKD